MGTARFPRANERFFCKIKEDKDFRRGVLWYAAQGNPPASSTSDNSTTTSAHHNPKRPATTAAKSQNRAVCRSRRHPQWELLSSYRTLDV